MTTENPYQAPESDVTQAQNNRPYQPKIFTPEGRIGRLRYLAYGLISYLCIIPAALIVGVVSGLTSGGSGEIGIFGGLLLAIIYIALIVYSFMLSKRRFNDLNKSGWLSLLLLVPLVNIFVGLWLIFAPGTAQANTYGPRPVKSPIGIVILALVMPIVMIVILAAVALPAYQDYVERAAAYENLSE